MRLPAALFSTLRSRRIPHGLWSAFKEGPPRIPIFFIRNNFLQRPWSSRLNGGLRYVLLGDKHASLDEEKESQQHSHHGSGESGVRIRYAILYLGAARTPLRLWWVRRMVC